MAGDVPAAGGAKPLIDRGQPLEDRLRQHHISMDKVLQEARTSQGLRCADEIEYAVLERSGGISIMPKRG